MDKKNYEAASLQVLPFADEDVITESVTHGTKTTEEGTQNDFFANLLPF